MEQRPEPMPPERPPLAERLEAYEARRRALREAGFGATYDAIAARMGAHKSTVQRIFMGARKRIGHEDEAQIERVLQDMEAECRAQFGSDALKGAQQDLSASRARADIARSSGSIERLPIYGAPGQDEAVGLAEKHIIGWLDLADVVRPTPGRDVFLFEVKADDMEPRYFVGERVLVRRNQPPQPGEDAVFEFADGRAELKTYRQRRQGHIWFQTYRGSVADADDALSVEATQVRALHAVVRL